MDNPNTRKFSGHDDPDRKPTPSDGVMSHSGSLTLSDSYVTAQEGSVVYSPSLRSGTLDSFRSISTDTFFTPPGSEPSRSRYGIKDILNSKESEDKDDSVCYMLRDSTDSQKTVKSVVMANGKVKSQASCSEASTPVTSLPGSKDGETPGVDQREAGEDEQSTIKRKKKTVTLPLTKTKSTDKFGEKMVKSPSSGLTTPSDKLTSGGTTPDESSNTKKLFKGGTKALLIQKINLDGSGTNMAESEHPEVLEIEEETVEPNDLPIKQNDRSFDAMSLMFHDYCGPVDETGIASHRNTECQTDGVSVSCTSAQTDESVLLALSSTTKASQISTSVQTNDVQTTAQCSQVSMSSMTYHDIKKDNELVNFYTGVGDDKTFQCLFDELSEAYYRDYPPSRLGRPKSLPLIDQFLMVLMRLRLGLLIVDLANRFNVSKSTCAYIINRWIDLMYKNLSFLIPWPARSIIDAKMPKGFRDQFPHTRVVIDCTELFTEKPHSLLNQSKMFSHYKGHNTYKGLVGVTPNGVLSFISNLYNGAVSDRQIVVRSGLLDLCEFGDGIMADTGFLISDLTTPKGLYLTIPPLRRKQKQFNLRQTEQTRRIANLRIHVERHMERVKNFRILQGIIPITISNTVNKIWKICNCLTALLPPLYPHDQESDDLEL